MNAIELAVDLASRDPTWLDGEAFDYPFYLDRMWATVCYAMYAASGVDSKCGFDSWDNLKAYAKANPDLMQKVIYKLQQDQL